jgi:hypothetical protein
MWFDLLSRDFYEVRLSSGPVEQTGEVPVLGGAHRCAPGRAGYVILHPRDHP